MTEPTAEQAEIYGDIREFVADLECGNINTWVKNGIRKIQKKTGSIGELTTIATKKNAFPTTRNMEEGNAQKKNSLSLKDMVCNVPVVAKKKLDSLRLTTKRTMEQKNESATELVGLTKTRSIETSLIHTNFFAGTATVQKPITENALTKVDLLTAGVPCQPASVAGRRRGTQDHRWLWNETFEVIRFVKPTWCLIENVRGLLTLERGMVFETLLASLETLGYEVQPFVIPACAVGAPHRRDRIWILAHSGSPDDKRRASRVPLDREGLDADEQAGDKTRSQLPRCNQDGWRKNWREVAFASCDGRLDDGLPRRVDGFPEGRVSYAKWRRDSLKALGNAIVPQVAYQIMRGIARLQQ